jgi:O-antigen/teichoic acid export membrane protein
MTIQQAAAPWPRFFASRTLLGRLWALALRDTNVVIASVITTNLLRAVSSVILTRLLVPEVFGIAGVIASVSFTVALVSDLGFQAFVVRHQDGDRSRFLDTIWTVGLIRSVLLTVLLIALATPIANTIGKPELAPLIAVSAITFVIEGLASLTLLTALRHRQILRLSLLELAVMVVQIVATAACAYVWRNYWAILAGMVISGAFKTALSYLAFSNSWRKFALERQYLRDLWGFARFVTGSSIITILLMQGDKLFLSGAMSLDHFGLYILAVNLASAPLAFTSAFSSRVLYPHYAQLWRDGAPDLRAQFYAKRRLPSLLYSFAAGGLIGSAPLIIAILYDPRYAGAAIFLQILAIGPLFALPSNAANEALTSTGRFAATLQASVFKLVWLGIAAPIGFVTGDAVGLVIAVALMEPAVLLFKWWQLGRISLLDMKQEALFLAPAIAGGFIGYEGDIWLRGLQLF